MTSQANSPIGSGASDSKKSKPKHFLAWSVLNQDLCQLEFFRRVLEEATDKSTPPLERLKFLSVFSSNLDEFFMVRVSGIKEMLDVDDIRPMPGELTPTEQLKAIREKVLALMEEHSHCLREEVLPQLQSRGLVIVPYARLTNSEKERLAKYFMKNVFLVLTPQAVDPSHPFPYVSNRSLNIGLIVESNPADTFAGFLVEEEVRFVRIK